MKAIKYEGYDKRRQISNSYPEWRYNHAQILKAISCLSKAGASYLVLVEFKEAPSDVFVDSYCNYLQRNKFRKAICDHWELTETKVKNK